MKKFVYIACAALTFCACDMKNLESGYFCDSHELIIDNVDSTVITGKLLIPADTSTFIGALSVGGDKLYLRTVNPNGNFKVYNLSGKQLGSFGKEGNAKNEYSAGAILNGQYMNGNVGIYDINKMTLSLVNGDETLKAKTPVIKKSFVTEPYSLHAFYINDTTIVYEGITTNNFCLTVVNPQTKNVKEKMDLYNTPHPMAMEIYPTHSTISPDGKHLAMGMMYMNQMNFISLTDYDRKSVSLYVDSQICEDRSKMKFYYRGITSNDKYVCGLYSNIMRKDILSNEQRKTEIHVFDWEGNFKEKLVTSDILHAITMDKDGNIYGLDKDQNIRIYKNAL